MTMNPVTLRADDTVGQAVDIMQKNRYLILPVGQELSHAEIVRRIEKL